MSVHSNNITFADYIEQFRIQKGSEHTHTSLWSPLGSFYIQSEDLENFYVNYTNALNNGYSLHITEKHRDISPFLIDLDFRFDKESGLNRKYTEDHLDKIVQIYVDIIQEWIQLEDDYEIYILEKPHPVRSKDCIKDGIHIVIPDIVTPPTVQYAVRSMVIEKIKFLIEDLSLINEEDDIIDLAVIEKNNWMMLGSKKSDGEPYKITYKYIINRESIIIKEKKDVNPSLEIIKLFSIRNKFVESLIRDDKKKTIQKMNIDIQKKRRDKLQTPILQYSKNSSRNECQNLEMIKKMVDVLDAKRADKFDTWIRVGWCLRNIDYRLLETWDQWSKKSEKYEEDKCGEIWNYMKTEGLGIGTLHMWCKTDNKEAYDKIMENDLKKLLFASKSETHFDIANVVAFIYKHEFVCVGIKQNSWYEFKNHKWVTCDSGHSLNYRISMNISKLYLQEGGHYATLGSTSDDPEEQDRYAAYAKKFINIASKLKITSFKENIMKECKNLFYVHKFEEKLDTRCHLLGFENGVYDLEIKEFREGRPEDWITFSTNINYIEYNPHDIIYDEINRFFSQVYTGDKMKEYVLLLLSSFLNGNIREEKFYIWTGSGSNGKTKVIDLFEKTMGEYCIKFPITLLTQKRASSNSATAEIARSKGKRFASLQEPGDDEKLNCGLMKEMSGGDKIQARGLYKDPIEFNPQFKMVLICNHLPKTPNSDDDGTWRRIRVNPHTSKFTDNPDKNNPLEFPIDLDLSKRFNEWKEYFMSLLIQYYKQYCTDGLQEPDEVLICTKEYQKRNDYHREFCDQCLCKDNSGSLTENELFNSFKYWIKEYDPSVNLNGKRKEIIECFDRILGNKIKRGWSGWTLKGNECKEEDLF